MRNYNLSLAITFALFLYIIESKCWYNEMCSQKCKFKFCSFNELSNSSSNSSTDNTLGSSFDGEKCCLGCSSGSFYFDKDSFKCNLLESTNQSCSWMEFTQQTIVVISITIGGMVLILTGAVVFYIKQSKKREREPWKFTGGNDINFR